MYIVIGEAVNHVPDSYTVLELDTFRDTKSNTEFTTWCVVENIPLADFPMLDTYVQTHGQLIKAYKDKNWDYCHCAIQGLKGKWNGELDSFYEILHDRVETLRDQELPTEWNGIIDR